MVISVKEGYDIRTSSQKYMIAIDENVLMWTDKTTRDQLADCFVELAEKYIVLYHTVGFTILDNYLLNNYVPLNGDVHFGLINLGFFERCFL